MRFRLHAIFGAADLNFTEAIWRKISFCDFSDVQFKNIF